MKDFLRCPNCKIPARKAITVCVTCPANNYKLDKKGLRSAKVEIRGVDWDNEKYYCPKCYFQWRIPWAGQPNKKQGEERGNKK